MAPFVFGFANGMPSPSFAACVGNVDRFDKICRITGCSAMAGASWTGAAHEAGFSDSSHLTRTHKRMFGIGPTAIRHE